MGNPKTIARELLSEYGGKATDKATAMLEQVKKLNGGHTSVKLWEDICNLVSNPSLIVQLVRIEGEVPSMG